MLSVGEKFPQFKVKATVSNDLNNAFVDIDNNTYKGKWLVVFFYPKDFTFVCPTEITGFADVHETAFRPWASNSIPRRFCTASAMLNDGRARQVHYSVIEDGGFAGFDSGVEWCVVGLDRNWAYNPSCKAARP